MSTENSVLVEEIKGWLKKIKLSDGVYNAGLTVFPLAAPNGHAPGYHLLQDALENKTAKVTEINEGGSVPELALEYTGDLPLLILEGDVLIGAKQNRAVNLTLLVPHSVSKFVIPVSCVEQGRWHQVTQEFSLKRHATSNLRSVKVASTLKNRRETGKAYSDQCAVWDSVGQVLDDVHASSPTSSLEDGYAHVEGELRNWREQCRLPQGTTGFVVARGGQVIGMDLFDHATTAERCWERLAESYFLDQLHAGEADAPTALEIVMNFLEQTVQGLQLSEKAGGLGREIEIDQPTLVGSGVWYEGRVVHLAVFARQ